jgi:hypothetical protein
VGLRLLVVAGYLVSLGARSMSLRFCVGHAVQNDFVNSKERAL